jgi:hypothetical protein
MKFKLFAILILLSACNNEENQFSNAVRNNCVDLEFNQTCLEISKRGIGEKFCEEDKNCNLICKPLDKEIHRQCCYNNDTYTIFLKSKKINEK